MRCNMEVSPANRRGNGPLNSVETEQFETGWPKILCSLFVFLFCFFAFMFLLMDANGHFIDPVWIFESLSAKNKIILGHLQLECGKQTTIILVSVDNWNWSTMLYSYWAYKYHTNHKPSIACYVRILHGGRKRHWIFYPPTSQQFRLMFPLRYQIFWSPFT